MTFGLLLSAALLVAPAEEPAAAHARAMAAIDAAWAGGPEDEQRAREDERQSRDEERKAREDERYDHGTEALDEGAWDEAIAAFGDVVAAKGRRADGALYWKAYATNKRGQREAALGLLADLRRAYPESRWLKEAKALEAEIRQQAGQPPRPEAEADEDLKVMAINSLLTSDPERALPMLEKLLDSSQSRKIQDRALFVLSQSGSPKAKEIVLRIAQGGQNPDLQRKAIQYLGIFGSAESRKTLAQIYATSTDRAVKKAVLHAYLVAGAKEQVLESARSEKDPELRREAIRTLGVMGGQAEVWTMYQSETDSQVKSTLLDALAIGGGIDRILEIAKSDKDREVRRDAIQKLGIFGGPKAAPFLVDIYKNETDVRLREAALQGLFVSGNAKALVEIAKAEKDPQMKKRVVGHLSHMNSKEGTDYLMELLNK